MLKTIDLIEQFSKFDECWLPHLIGEVNDCAVKVAKLHGEFEWHSHAKEDELFLVVKGSLTIRLRGSQADELVLNEGQLGIVPRGIEHQPVAENEAWVLLFEPKGTVNTGENETSDRTRKDLPKLTQ